MCRKSLLYNLQHHFWTVYGRWKQCVRLRHHKEKLSHTRTLYFASKDWKTALLYVAVYSWGQTNMAGKESSTGGSQYQSNGRNKTIPMGVKDMAESNLIGKKTLIGRILKLEKGLLKISLNLAIILYILWWRWGQFVAVSECHKQEQIDKHNSSGVQHHTVYI